MRLAITTTHLYMIGFNGYSLGWVLLCSINTIIIMLGSNEPK